MHFDGIPLSFYVQHAPTWPIAIGDRSPIDTSCELSRFTWNQRRGHGPAGSRCDLCYLGSFFLGKLYLRSWLTHLSLPPPRIARLPRDNPQEEIPANRACIRGKSTRLSDRKNFSSLPYLSRSITSCMFRRNYFKTGNCCSTAVECNEKYNLLIY